MLFHISSVFGVHYTSSYISGDSWFVKSTTGCHVPKRGTWPLSGSIISSGGYNSAYWLYFFQFALFWLVLVAVIAWWVPDATGLCG